MSCIGFWGKWFGHYFEARYSEKSSLPPNTKIRFNFPDEVEAMKNYEKMYHYDICVRCGVVIKKVEVV